jgi:hypothetical protein
MSAVLLTGLIVALVAWAAWLDTHYDHRRWDREKPE